mmetsp:Transcript_42604/g.106567  ORF Transcript_42604/g.106567 Transcript_42604/m.106567 type:complete len:218 (+) Transcript_42604:288-941(+)
MLVLPLSSCLLRAPTTLFCCATSDRLCSSMLSLTACSGPPAAGAVCAAMAASTASCAPGCVLAAGGGEMATHCPPDTPSGTVTIMLIAPWPTLAMNFWPPLSPAGTWTLSIPLASGAAENESPSIDSAAIICSSALALTASAPSSTARGAAASVDATFCRSPSTLCATTAAPCDAAATMAWVELASASCVAWLGDVLSCAPLAEPLRVVPPPTCLFP